MKPTASEIGAIVVSRTCTPLKKWSCRGNQGNELVSQSGDYSRSSQTVRCRNTCTPLKGIRARCLDCTAGSLATVRNCNFKEECPLWPFRMGKGVKGKGGPLRPIRCYCLWCMNGQLIEIRHCTSPECSLYLYRFGRRPRKTTRQEGVEARTSLVNTVVPVTV